MAYRIEYEAFGPKKTGFLKKYGMFLFILLLLVTTVTVSVANLSGAQWARSLLFPGDPGVTAVALEELAEDLQQGSSVKDAFAAFCREVIGNGV